MSWPVLSLFVLAAGLRLWILSRPGLGDDFDLGLFVRWMRTMNESGFAGFYGSGQFGDYPPVMMLLFRGVGAVVSAVSENPTDHAFRVGIKCLACGFEILIGALILFEGKRLLGVRAGTVAAGLFLLNPAALYESAYWGQVDAIPTAFMVASLVLVGRGRWTSAGFVAALGLTAKFQAVILLPLLVFEAFRMVGLRGLVRLAAGGAIGVALAAAPFFATGTLTEIVDRAYINVVGQYPKMSNNAYNIWFVKGDPGMPNTSPPQILIEAAAGEETSVAEDASWLLRWTWRKISLVLFALSVAVVLSLYASSPGPRSRLVAAGLLVLCFYLFPTEMHERYAYPALALLAPWAAVRGLHERVYWVLSAVLLLNLAAVVPIAPLAPQLSAVNLALFAGILATLALPSVLRRSDVGAPGFVPAMDDASANATLRTPGPDALAEPAPPAWRRSVVRGFQYGTVLAVLAAATVVAVVQLGDGKAKRSTEDGHVAWLSDLEPREATQEWGGPAADRSVAGGPLRVGSRFYLRGLGTHAPARLVYDIPEGSRIFEATLGIDRSSAGGGSATIRIEVDGKTMFESAVLRANSAPLTIEVPVSDARSLRIAIDPTGDGQRSDHVDLALARFRE